MTLGVRAEGSSVVVQGLVVLGLLSACVRSSEGREPETQVKCQGTEPRPASTALPDSFWLRVGAEAIEKVSVAGDVSWVARLPNKAPLLPGIAVAANSNVYLRDRQELFALGNQGRWLWQRPAPIDDAVDRSYQPVAMSDSGVIVRSGRRQYRAYSPDGEVRWSVDVDLDGTINEPPVVLPNGMIVARSTSGFVALAPDGLVQ